MQGRSKGGPAEGCLGALRDCIARGLDATAEDRAQIEAEMDLVRTVAATVDAAADSYDERLATFDLLVEQYVASSNAVERRFAGQMIDWRVGLFIGDGVAERRIDAKARPYIPENNYGIERWFRTPKGHARHVHGRAHAGVALVQRGATLVPTLDAHVLHSAPFTHDDLRPFYGALEPAPQTVVRRRAHIMRRGRSEKRRPLLLKQLQDRYAALA